MASKGNGRWDFLNFNDMFEKKQVLKPGDTNARAELPNLCFQLSCSAAGFAPAQPWKSPMNGGVVRWEHR